MKERLREIIKDIYYDDNLEPRFLFRYWRPICVGITMFLVIPVVLNYLIIQESRWEYAGSPKEWLMFWPTYIGAFASFAMVFATYKTLRNNEEILHNNKVQLEELRLQRYISQEPDISVTLNHVGDNLFIHIINISNVEVSGLNIEVKEVSDALRKQVKDFGKLCSRLKGMQVDIEPHGKRNILLVKNPSELDVDDYIELDVYFAGGIYNGDAKGFCEVRAYVDLLSVPDDDRTNRDLQERVSNLERLLEEYKKSTTKSGKRKMSK